MVQTSTEWTRPAIRKLIALYKENPHLYDMKNNLYYKKQIRNKTLSEIAQKLESERLGTTIDDILKKIQTLRTQFGQELHKSRKSVASSNLSDEVVYEPTVWWYQDLFFLRKFIKPRKEDSYTTSIPEATTKEIEEEEDEESEQFIETEIVSREKKLSVEKEPAEVFIEDFTLNEISDNSEVTVYEIQNQKCLAMTSPGKAPKVDSKTVKIIQAASSSPGSFFPATHSQIRTTESESLDRNQELAKFVASQMALIKDDYLFYNTQHEILSIVNKAQLNQLLKDKGIEPKL